MLPKQALSAGATENRGVADATADRPTLEGAGDKLHLYICSYRFSNGATVAIPSTLFCFLPGGTAHRG